MEYNIQKQHIERIDMLYRYLYDSKKFIIRELERILVDTIGFNNELEFSEEIEGFDKIRVNNILGIQIHYNKDRYEVDVLPPLKWWDSSTIIITAQQV